jgi:hypothetical protein
MPLYVPQHTPTWKQGYASCASESANPGLWKGLVGLWMPSLGPTGLTLRDISGWENHGTIEGGLWVTEEKGYVLNYPTSTQRVLVPNTPQLQAASGGDFTISCWFRYNAALVNDLPLVLKSVSTSTTWWEFGLDGDFLSLTTDDGSTKQTLFTTAFDFDSDGSGYTWYHVAVTRKQGDVVGFYLDGQLLEEVATINGNCASTNDIEISGVGSQIRAGADKDIGDVGLWGCVLSPSEIQTLYQDPHALVRQRAMWLPAAGAVTPPTGNRRRRLLIGA